MILALGLLGLGLEAGFGNLGSVEVPIEPSAIQAWGATPGRAYVTPAPGPQGTSVARATLSRLVLLEDGRPLRPHVTPEVVGREGRGSYGHWERRLVFSSSDGSDPRSGLHRYTARVPRVFPTGLSWLLVALGVFLGAPWGRGGLELLRRASPIRVAGLLALLTGALRILWDGETGLVSTALAGQLPTGDARLWLELSEDFARGSRAHGAWLVWGARPPLTYWVNGSWGALFGVSALSLTVFNGVCSALGAALIYDALRRLAPPPVALVGALAHAFSRMDTALGLTPLSEPSGAFLSTVAIWLFALALSGEAAGERPRWSWFLGGLVLSLSTLSRPLTLLAGPAIPLVVFLVRRARNEPLPWRAAARAGALCVAGMILILLPWLIRQQVQYGVFALTDETAELLSAASDPRHGAGPVAVSQEAVDAGPPGVAARDAYYTAKFRENLSRDPGYYLRNLVTLAGRSLIQQLASPTPFFALGLLLLAFWSGSGRAPPGWTLVALTLGLAYGLADSFGLAPRTWPWILLGAALVLVRGAPAALLATTLGVALLAIGALATPSPHLTDSLQWLALPLALLGPWELVRRAAAGGEVKPALEPLPFSGLSRCLAGALIGLAVILGVGLTVALARSASGGQASAALPDLRDEAAWRVSALRDEAAGPYRDLWPLLVVERGDLRPAFRSHHPPGEALVHPARAFGAHDELDRTYFLLEPALEAPAEWRARSTHCLFPGPVQEGSARVTLVGLWVRSPGLNGGQDAVFEVLAYTESGTSSGATWSYGRPISRSLHAAMLRVRRRGGWIYQPPR
ncbi:MAG: glycosyltransferase family 39 protein [Planctomycetes bacterium]|nr:glycosyltransferase family 39 protein [Planctomycetota bacterium]